MHLDSRQTDRAVGALLGAAVGDALGVPYEYGSRPLEPVPTMHGGGLGGLAPGQWSDDTEMALCIAQVAATVPTCPLNGRRTRSLRGSCAG